MEVPPSAICKVDDRTQSGVAALTLCRPAALNSLNESLLDQLGIALESAIRSADVESVCIHGGGGAFMAGADLPFFLRTVLSGDLDRVLRFTQNAHQIQQRLESCPKPTVAWVEGLAYGAGLELALACQRVVAGPTAKFSLPETGLGIYPGMGGTQRIPRRIGIGLAKWMIFTGAVVPAAQALEIGLIDAIHLTATDPREAVATPVESKPELSDQFKSLKRLFSVHTVAELCDPTFALPSAPHLARAVVQVRGKAPLALALAEKIIDAGVPLPLGEAIELEFMHLREVFATADARAGLLSQGKTRATFTGR